MLQRKLPLSRLESFDEAGYRDGDKHFVTQLVAPALYSIFVLDLPFYLGRCS